MNLTTPTIFHRRRLAAATLVSKGRGLAAATALSNPRGHAATLGSRRCLLAASLVVSMLAGCSAMVGRPTTPLTAKRDEPGVDVCMSERTSNGGIRIVGKLNKGIYPITGATIEYRSAGVSDAVPASADRNRLDLAGARSEKVTYRKGADEVAFTIDPDGVRSLKGKVLWYRWTIAYDRGGSEKIEETEIHRTSADEAGLPRAADNPGPDASVALAGAAYR